MHSGHYETPSIESLLAARLLHSRAPDEMLADAGNLTGFCRNNKDMLAMHDRQAGWFAHGIQRSAPGHPNAPRSTPNTLQRLNIGYLFILGILAAHPAHSFGSQTVACSSSALHTVNPTRIAVSPSFLAVCAQPQRCTVCRRASPRSSLPGTITLIAIFPVPGPGGCPTLEPLRRFNL
jgi:hypothetical protein